MIRLKCKPLKPLPLEGPVPPLGNFPEKHKGCKRVVVFDIVENRDVAAIVSLRDLHIAGEFSHVESLSDNAMLYLSCY